MVLARPGTRAKAHGAVLGQTPASATSPGCVRDTVTAPTHAPTQLLIPNTTKIAAAVVATVLLVCLSGFWLYKYSGLLEKE